MEPTLREGEEVLVDAFACRRLSPRSGEVVLLRHPLRSDLRVIERVARLAAEGVRVRGDNPVGSTDGRSFGALPAQ